MKVIASLLSFLISFAAVAKPPENFAAAKKIVFALFRDHPVTLYCGCHYDYIKRVDHKSCGIQPTINVKQAARVEIEHIMSVKNFAKQLRCGREKLCTNSKGKKFSGPQCCQKIDGKYRQAESELFNLWPSAGILNQAIGSLGSYRFGELDTNDAHDKFGDCQLAIDEKNKVFEPRTEVKGLVARANLFMAKKYNISLSKAQRALFNKWNAQFAPNEWEKEWEQKVADIEGYHNKFITNWP